MNTAAAIKDIQTHLAAFNEGLINEKECLENILQAANDGLLDHFERCNERSSQAPPVFQANKGFVLSGGS